MEIIFVILATNIILVSVILLLVSMVLKKAEDQFFEYQREYEDKE